MTIVSETDPQWPWPPIALRCNCPCRCRLRDRRLGHHRCLSHQTRSQCHNQHPPSRRREPCDASAARAASTAVRVRRGLGIWLGLRFGEQGTGDRATKADGYDRNFHKSAPWDFLQKVQRGRKPLDDVASDLAATCLFCTKLLPQRELCDHFFGFFKFLYVCVNTVQVIVPWV